MFTLLTALLLYLAPSILLPIVLYPSSSYSLVLLSSLLPSSLLLLLLLAIYTLFYKDPYKTKPIYFT